MDSAQAEILVKELLGKEVGEWRIERFLGKGKSAVVMAGTRGLDQGAIKIFHPELIERYGKSMQLERIMREKSLVGACHPNLVRILDGGECGVTGYLYVVMELLPHPNMHDVLLKVPNEAIPNLIAQVASAARFLEDRNLAHRDIKPENIAVSADFSTAVLLDCGVLRPIGASDLTDVDQRAFIGTLRYSSPEFLERREDDTVEGWRAVTFYQLGAVLHDLLMRRALFEDESVPFARLVRAVSETIPKIHSENVRCVALANHCLIKDPVARAALVTWERFQNLIDEDTPSLAVARDRIKMRQTYLQSTPTLDGGAEKNPRAIRKILEDVCNRMESRLAALMNNLQAFPLRTTQSSRDLSQRACEILVNFEADEQKGLSFRMAVLLRVVLFAENLGVCLFHAEASAAWADYEVPVPDMPPPIIVYSGELEPLLDGPTLELVFVSALEDAYSRTDQGVVPSTGEVVALLVKGEAQ